MSKFSLATFLGKLAPNHETKASDPQTRVMRLEQLESRELLSATPGSEFRALSDANVVGFISSRFTVEEAQAAYESSVASRVDDLIDITETMLDGAVAENSPVASITVDGGVSGPGEPSVYYDADKSQNNTEDDALCWAATASNMLWYTGWASVVNAKNEQDFFDSIFVNSWLDVGGKAETGISWFMNDESYYGGSTSAYGGAGYYSQLMGQYGESPTDYVATYTATKSDALQTLASSLVAGDAVGLSMDIYNSRGNGHAVTCWGYAVDTTYSATDPRYYVGLYITNSDDESKYDDELNERKLVYVGLEWNDNLSRLSSNGATVGGYLLDLNGRTGDSRFYLYQFETLSQRPEKYASFANVEKRSTVVSTIADVYNVYDGKISLREALVSAHSGDTITFANSLKGKTILIDSELGALLLTKTVTIDASALRNMATSAPGLTINGQGASRALYVNRGVNATVNGVAITNCYSSSNGGAIYDYYGNLTLINCSLTNNTSDSFGGGIYSAWGTPTFVNCVVASNAGYGGGGAYFYSGTPTLVNSVVTNNVARFSGGGLYGSGSATIKSYNSIVCGNSSTYSGSAVADVYLYGSNVVANAYNTLSTFTNWTNGEDNLTYDASKPLFTNATAGDYSLANGSQAIDKGNDLYVASTVDFAGKKRISGASVDLGAYEYQNASDPTMLATPSVDYGASYGSIKASWKSIQNASGYRIAYRIGDGAWTTVDVAASKTSYSITGLTGGKTYSLKVAALGNGTTRQTSYYSKETFVKPFSHIIVTSIKDVVDADDGVVTLREALSVAGTGDKITFASSLKGKTITLDSNLGQLKVTKSLTIDALSFYNASTKTPGITISGGDATRIMLINSETSPVIKGVKFTKGRSPACGGAIWNNGDLTVENCVFSDNNATFLYSDGSTGNYYGGAIAVKPGASLTAVSSAFSGNAGGGTVSFQTDLSSSFTDCVIKGSSDDGLCVVTGEVVLDNCEISENACFGIYAFQQGSVLANDCVVSSNGLTGIYVYKNDGEISLNQCAISKNARSGIYVYQGSVSSDDCVVSGNSSQGINCGVDGTINASNTLVFGNSATTGAGIQLYGTANLYNCTITGNTASVVGGVNLNSSAVLNAYNTIITGNVSTNAYYAHDVYKYNTTATANAYNVLSTYSAWDASSGARVYDATKPLFTNAADGDYTLAENSQAIDKGNNTYVSVDSDLAGEARISNGTVDLGAYEYQVAADPVPLDAPKNTRETAKTETTITVAWDAVANASGYQFLYKKSTDSAYTTVKLDANTKSYALSDLDNSATYNWRVRAIGDGASYLTSAYSATRSVKPRQKLDAPTFTTQAKSSTSVTFTWAAVANASGYKILYKKSTDSNYTSISVNANATTYALTGLASGTTYVFKMGTVGDGFNYGNSAYSNPVADPVPLDAPKNTRETAKTETTITVAWDAVANASGYQFIYKKSSESSYTTVKLDVNTTSYKLSGLDNTATYYWKVRALGDGTGSLLDSEYSATRTVKPRQQLATPSNDSYAATPTSITIGWDAVAKTSSYKIMYKKTTDSSYTTISDVAAAATSYTITGLTKNSKYYVKFAAIGDGLDYSSSAYTTLTTVSTPDVQKLDAPANPNSVATGKTITVSWDAVANAAGYNVIYKKSTDSSYASFNLAANATSYKLTGLDNTATYYWKVRALGDGTNYTNSDYTATQIVKFEDVVKLTTPTNPKETAKTATSITVAWDAVPNAAGYKLVYRKASSSTSYKEVSVGSNTSYKITGLDASSWYYWQVQALGSVASQNSDYTTIRPTRPTQKLATPTVEYSAAPTSITVSWNAVPNASGYNIKYLKSGGSYIDVNVDASATSYTITGLSPDTKYSLKVRATGDTFVNFSASDFSDLTAVSTPDFDPVKLPEPTNLRATAKTETTITVAWDAVENASGYQLIYKKSTEYSYTQVSLTSASTSYKLTGLDNSAAYYWKVKALGDGVYYLNSDFPATQSARPRQKLSTPSNVAYDAGSTAISVTWAAVANASSYRIMYKRSTDSSYATINVTGVSATNYSVSGLTADADYFFKIAAIGDGLNYASSDYTALATVHTQPSVLTTPTNTRETAKKETAITVAWDAVENASGYQLRYKKSTDSSYGTAISISVDKTSHQLTGLDNSATYQWQVRAVGDSNYKTSAYSKARSTKPQQKLTAPILDESETLSTTTTITVAWNQIVGASGYRVMYKPSDGSYTTVDISGGATTRFTASKLETGKNYVFKVAALGDSFDYATSAYSSVVSILCDRAQLETPSVTLSSTASTVTIIWDPVPNASSYTYYFNGIERTTNETAHIFAYAPSKTTYQVQVRANAAEDSANYRDSEWSKVQNVTTAALVKLGKPTVTVTAETQSTISLSWTPVAGACGYQLTYLPALDSLDNPAENYYSTVVAADVTSHTFTNLAKARLYVVGVQALGDSLETTASGYGQVLYTSTLDTTSALASDDEWFREDEWFDELEDDYDLLAANFLTK